MKAGMKADAAYNKGYHEGYTLGYQNGETTGRLSIEHRQQSIESVDEFVHRLRTLYQALFTFQRVHAKAVGLPHYRIHTEMMAQNAFLAVIEQRPFVLAQSLQETK